MESKLIKIFCNRNYMPYRSSWKKQEDQYLLALVKQMKSRRWKCVRNSFKAMFPDKDRTSKQLRERYKNYLQFDEGNKLILEWSKEEVAILFQIYKNHGPRWTYCSSLIRGKYSFLLDRSESALKNKFYSLIRKFVRKISFLRKEFFGKMAKPLKYESIIRALDINHESCCLPDDLYKQAEELKNKIIALCQMNLDEVGKQEILEFSNKFFQFNYSTRFYRVRKVHKKKNSEATETEKNQSNQNNKNILEVKREDQVEPVLLHKTQENYETGKVTKKLTGQGSDQPQPERSNKISEKVQPTFEQAQIFYHPQPHLMYAPLFQTFQLPFMSTNSQVLGYYKMF